MPKSITYKVKEEGVQRVERQFGKLDKRFKTMRISTKGLQRGLGVIRNQILLATFAFGGMAAAMAKAVKAAAVQELAVKKLEAALKSTGGVAGVTSKELQALASSFQKTTTFGDEEILSAQSLMLTFTKLGKEVFPQATEAILNISTAMGQDLRATTIQVGKALNDPILGITALRRVGIQFTGTQEDLIRNFVKMGNVVGAQKIILGELETQFGGLAKAAAQTMAGALKQASNAGGDMAEAFGGLLQPTVIGVSKWFKRAAESATEFFKASTETSLETTIRQLQDMGVATLELELTFARLRVAQAELVAVGLGDEERARERITKSSERQVDLLKTLGDEQRKIIIAGTTEKELRDKLNHLTTQGAALGLPIGEGIGKRNKVIRQGIVDQLALIDASNENLEISREQQEEYQNNLDKILELKSANDKVKEIQKLIVLETEKTSDTVKKLTGGYKAGKEELKAQKTQIDAIRESFAGFKEELGEGKFFDVDIDEVFNSEKIDEFFDNEEQRIIKSGEKWDDQSLNRLNWLERIDKAQKKGAISQERFARAAATAATSLATSFLSGDNMAEALKRATIQMLLMVVQAKLFAYFMTIGTGGANLITGKPLATAGLVAPLAHGADFTTSGPQLLLVGDNPGGRERVSVTPQSSANINGPQGNIVIHINNPVLLDDAAVNQIAPAIRRAIDLGETSGLS